MPTPFAHADSDAGSATYDVIVIGGGPVGENVADRDPRGGRRAAIIEQDLVGDECSYWPCTPTALLRGTAALHAARRLPGAREAITGELETAAGPAPPRRLRLPVERRRPGRDRPTGGTEPEVASMSIRRFVQTARPYRKSRRV